MGEGDKLDVIFHVWPLRLWARCRFEKTVMDHALMVGPVTIRWDAPR